MPVFLDDKGNMQLDNEGREKLKTKLDYYKAILELKEIYGGLDADLRRICSNVQNEMHAFEKLLWNDDLHKLPSALEHIDSLLLEAQDCITRVYSEKMIDYKEAIEQIIIKNDNTHEEKQKQQRR